MDSQENGMLGTSLEYLTPNRQKTPNIEMLLLPVLRAYLYANAS